MVYLKEKKKRKNREVKKNNRRDGKRTEKGESGREEGNCGLEKRREVYTEKIEIERKRKKGEKKGEGM